MRMRSIKWKLIVMYLGLVLIVMIVSGSYILLSLRNIEIDKSQGELEQYAEKIHEQVIESGNPEDFQQELLRTVDVTIRRLREKLEDTPGKPDFILTKRGVGYYFDC